MPHCPHRWAQVRKASTASLTELLFPELLFTELLLIELLFSTPPPPLPDPHEGFGECGSLV